MDNNNAGTKERKRHLLQVYIDKDQYTAIRDIAYVNETTLSELYREAVDIMLNKYAKGGKNSEKLW